MQRSKYHLLLDRDGWENYTPRDPNIVVGDYSKVREELKRMEQQPGYLFEIQYTNWRQAMDKFFPECETVLFLRRPRYTGPNTARIDYWVKEASYHPHSDASYILAKEGARWRIVKHWGGVYSM